MTSVPENLVGALRSFSARNDAAEVFFDQLASRTNDFRETKVRVAVANTGLKRAQIMEIFREMEILGVGKVVVGRKGYETRFRWNYKMTEVGKAAVGEIDEFEIADDLEESDEEEGGLVTHEFKIRKDVIAIVRAPSDLTEREAERLAKFIQTLPL